MAGENQVIDIALQTDPQRVNFNLQNSGGSVSFDLSNGSDVSNRFIDDTAGAGVTNKTWSANKLTGEFGNVATDINRLSEPNKNLINPDLASSGVSDYIPITPSLRYVLTHADRGSGDFMFTIYTYDANKENMQMSFVQLTSGEFEKILTFNAGRAYLKISVTNAPSGIDKTDISRVYFGKFSDGQSFVPYHYSVPDKFEELIDDTAGVGDSTKVWSADKSATETNSLLSALNVLDGIVNGTPGGQSINLFNPNDPDILTGGYIDSSTGEFVSYSGYFESGFIACETGDTITVTYNGNYITGSRHVAFYNSSKQFVSGENYNTLPTFTIPSGGIAYCRIALSSDKTDTLMIVKNDTTIHEYVPYYIEPSDGLVDDVDDLEDRVSELEEDYTAISAIVEDQTEDVSDIKETLNGEPGQPSINLFNPDDPDVLDGKYLDTNGTQQTDSGYIETGYIECVKTDTFTLTSNGSYLGSSKPVCYYDENKNFISGVTAYLPTFTVNVNTAKYFRIPLSKSLTKVMIVKNDTTIHEYVPYGPTGGTPGIVDHVDDLESRVSELESGSATKEELDDLNDEVEDIETDLYGTMSINLFNPNDPDILTGGYLDTSGVFDSNSSYNETGYIPCVQNDTFTFSINGEYLGSSRPICLYDENKQFISGITGYMPTITVNVANVKYIRVPIRTDEFSGVMIVKNDTTIHDYVPYGLVGGYSSQIEENSEDIEDINEKLSNYDVFPWDGKACVCLGDSIMYNDAHSEINGYQYYISQLGFATVTNRAVSGACVAYHSESHYEDVCTTVDNIDFTAYDLALVAGGTNDYGFSSATPIGTLVNSATASDFDKTTFIGALQYILTKILNSNVTIKIALFTPLKRSGYYNSNSENKVLKDYADAIKEVGEYYSVPVLDYYSMSGINRKNVYTLTSDGLHPNNDGYLFVSKNKLTSFINSL